MIQTTSLITRRKFIETAIICMPVTAIAQQGLSSSFKREVMTATGPFNASELGTTLMHEHVMVDFVGADRVNTNRYRASEVFDVALPFLKRAARAGCATFVECTPAYLGRDAALLKKLSAAAGLKIITNTGYYGAVQGKYVPTHAYRETAKELAARWTKEFNEGIEGTRVRPGMIKISVDGGKLSEINRKLVEAAALTHLQTGLTIGSHTGDGVAAMEQLDVISRLGVSPKSFIWIHAQNEHDKEMHVAAARRGCWVEFDGVSGEQVKSHLDLVTHMADRGLMSQVLVSMDAGWYHVGEPGGGKYRGYESLFTEFLPILRQTLGEAETRKLITINPQNALTLEVRSMPISGSDKA